MKVFLIRHAKGDTQRGCWQKPETPLGSEGRLQATKLSNLSRFNGYEIIITSSLLRSVETGKFLSKRINVPLIQNALANERRQSTNIYGVNLESNIGKKYYESYKTSTDKMNWKFDETEESLNEVVDRANKLAKIITTKYLDKNIIVISHDNFIRIFLTCCVFGLRKNSKSFQKVFNSISINNCGISLIEYSKVNSSWKTFYLNDFSYLFH